MNTGIIKDLALRLVDISRKHAPEILAGLGIGGFITTSVLAAKAAPEAAEKIEKAKVELDVDELTPVQTVKTVWKDYLPAVATGVTSTLCIVGSVNTSLKRNAALATAYEMSKTLMDEYRAKTIDIVGEKKEQKIRNAIAQDHVENYPPMDDINVINPEDGGTLKILVQDELSGYYMFVDNLDKIRYAIGRGYDKQEKSFDESMSEYEWYCVLEPRITDYLTETQIHRAQNSFWSSATPYEGFSCELNESSLKTVTVGKWKGYPCYSITYGSTPKYQEYWRAY